MLRQSKQPKEDFKKKKKKTTNFVILLIILKIKNKKYPNFNYSKLALTEVCKSVMLAPFKINYMNLAFF